MTEGTYSQTNRVIAAVFAVTFTALSLSAFAAAAKSAVPACPIPPHTRLFQPVA